MAIIVKGNGRADGKDQEKNSSLPRMDRKLM
jgi:hypothetical protein